MIELCYWGYASGGEGHRVASHAHDYLQSEFVVSGKCDVTADGKIFPLKTGDILFLAPGVVHSLHYRSDFLAYTFKFRSDLIGFEKILHLSGGGFATGAQKAVEAVFQTTFPSRFFGVSEGAVILREDRYQYLMEGLLEGILRHLSAEKDKLTGPLAHFREILSGPGGHSFSVAEAAEKCGCSRNRFSLLVKRWSGQTAKDFLTRLRVEDAIRFLRFSDLNVGEISRRLGFSSPFHFSDFFKRETGLSPLHYRRKYFSPEKER
ncbi:MAG: AraC family transcriptional regulator [Victivallaceae bacterium]|nr:AraC family transcriptional regulator [Victivallaceae bacterium]